MTVFCATIHPLRRSIVVKKRNASSILESFGVRRSALLHLAAEFYLSKSTSLVGVNRVSSITTKQESNYINDGIYYVVLRRWYEKLNIVCQADAPNPGRCVMKNIHRFPTSKEMNEHTDPVHIGPPSPDLIIISD